MTGPVDSRVAKLVAERRAEGYPGYREVEVVREFIEATESAGLVLLDPKADELWARLERVLVAHQRHDRPPVFNSCLCGWTQLGLSFPGHQVDMLLAELAP